MDGSLNGFAHSALAAVDMARHPAAAVVMEACGSAHYWSRVLSGFGHEVRLIAPRYVRPVVKRQKNDAADAEAIVVAAQRPEMRFVEPKSEAQQPSVMLTHVGDSQRDEFLNLWLPVGGHCHGCSDWIAGRL